MKSPVFFLKATLGLLLFSLALQPAQNLQAIPFAFTVSPASVSNTYSGFITLQISGPFSGSTFVVQKYLDRNHNGIIDAGDLLVQQIQLTDGQGSPVIAGATNINVPGDLNPTNGSITTQLSMAGVGVGQQIVGQYLYKLSDPLGVYGPVTNTFAVTALPYPQSFSGNVVSNQTTTAVPYSAVLLLQPGNNFRPLAATVADASGHYSITVPPGTYKLAALNGTNFLSDLGNAPVLALGSGTAITTNINLVPATATVSGKLVDAANTNFGLPGIFLAAIPSNQSAWGFGVSDTNGNFVLPANSTPVNINEEQQDFDVLGYIGLNNGTNASAGSTNTVIGLPKATALFYGSVRDTANQPLAGVRIGGNYGNTGNGLYQGDGASDQNGNYAVGVVAGNWDVETSQNESGPQFANYIFSSGPDYGYNNGGAGTNITAGTAVQANFGGMLATNYINGRVASEYDFPISGVGVGAFTTINSFTYNAPFTNTVLGGYYTLFVGTGDWTVFVDCDDLHAHDYPVCPDNQNVDINNNNATVNFAVPFASYYVISGHVLDAQNNPVVGVTVNCQDGTNFSTITDAGGFYIFNKVTNDTWVVSVDCPSLTTLGYGCVPSQTTNIFSENAEVDFSVSPCQSLAITTSFLNNCDAGASYNASLQNIGCASPYAWSLTPGSLALPVTLQLSTNGTISGIPGGAAVGTNYFSVRVTDAQMNVADQSLSLIVYPAPQITNTSLPAGVLNAAYSAQLGSTGGGPGGLFGWNIISGSLPPGLTLALNGAIFGTNTATGTFNFTVGAGDNQGTQLQKALSITVGSPQITGSLTNGIQGVFYSSQFQVAGGQSPYTWTIANGSQQPPANLTLSTAGLLSGIPTVNGTFSFIVKETDANSVSVTKSFSLTINATASNRPKLGAPLLSGNHLQFNLTGAAGQNYTIQSSTNLAGTNWTTLFITNNASSNSFLVTLPGVTNNGTFYRALIGP